MTTLHLPAGFLWSSATAGLKPSGKPDLALALCPQSASAAAVFTTNRVTAAPLQIGKEHLKKSRGRVSAVIVNAGNANCGTGAHGKRAALAVCAHLAKVCAAPIEQVFPSSTGIIGVPLPYEKIVDATSGLAASASSMEEAVQRFANAIITTDTRAKVASATLRLGGKHVRILGVAKGSGMIHPNMATMLAYIFTDAGASPALLQRMLKRSVDQSFNCISVDGDTSTNDTVLLLASGASGARLNTKDAARFQAALDGICLQLAQEVVADGEGVRHVVRIDIESAHSVADARAVARAIANSPLVKSAWAGADPNWGRILAAIGYSGVRINPEKVNVYIADQQVCKNGAAVPFDADAAHRAMLEPSYEVRVQLGMGKAELRFFGCDLSQEYVAINSEYST